MNWGGSEGTRRGLHKEMDQEKVPRATLYHYASHLGCWKVRPFRGGRRGGSVCIAAQRKMLHNDNEGNEVTRPENRTPAFGKPEKRGRA